MAPNEPKQTEEKINKLNNINGLPTQTSSKKGIKSNSKPVSPTKENPLSMRDRGFFYAFKKCFWG